MVSVWWVFGSYALLAVGMAACAWLFMSALSQSARLRAQHDELRAEVARLQEAQGQETKRLQARLAEVSRSMDATPPAVADPSLTAARRSMVLRMARAGKSPDRIAEALQLPQGEIRLLLKLQRMAGDTLAGGAGAS